MKKQELRHDVFRENVVKGIQYFNENSATVIKALDGTNYIVTLLFIISISGMDAMKFISTKSRVVMPFVWKLFLVLPSKTL